MLNELTGRADPAALRPAETEQSGSAQPRRTAWPYVAAREPATRLPSAATRRLGGIKAGGPWSSSLRLGPDAAMRSVGLVPVGTVSAALLSSRFRFTSPTRLMRAGGGADDPLTARSCGGFVHDYSRGAGGEYLPDAGWTWERMLHEDRERQLLDAVIRQLRAEATSIGAYGVVGIELTVEDVRGPHDEPFLELRSLGTAVGCPRAPMPPSPILTTLGGSEVATLLEAGYVPVDVVYGVGAVKSAPARQTSKALATFGGGELPQFDDALNAAIRIAIRDLEHRARGQARLIVSGTPTLHLGRELGSELEATVRILGSSVRCFAHPPPAASPLSFIPLVSLNDTPAAGS